MTYSIPADVHDGDPWKYDGRILLNFLQNYRIDFDPLNFYMIILVDNVFEFPGFPIKSTGILFKIDTRDIKIFYSNGLLRATFYY